MSPRRLSTLSFPLSLAVGLCCLLGVDGYNGNHSPMIIPTNGWTAIEIITEGDTIGPTGTWAIPDQMDGLGAFLVSNRWSSGPGDSDSGDTTLRLHVNHEDEEEATITEIDLHKGRLKQAISHAVLTSRAGGASVSNNYNFVQSARVAYDRWSPDGGTTWKYIGGAISDPAGAGGFCRFCSSQFYPADAFGTGRGFQDAIYMTGEECWDSNGRLFALDANDSARDLYLVSGVTGSMPLVRPMEYTAAGAWLSAPVPQTAFEEGHGGMPFDSWENAALIDTGETNHVALLLSADGGSETLKLYIGKKFTNAYGYTDRFGFLARNGLAYGRWFYLGGLEWTMNDATDLWESTTKGRFVTDEDDAWSESKFEDIDTNPVAPNQAVLAESNSGVYVLDFDLRFGVGDGSFRVDQSGFSVRMVTSSDHKDMQYPDNVDWTKNNLIFVNKDNDSGGIWYMNPDGTGKVQVGETRSSGESTGILDVSALLDYPPASAMLTSNQGSPSSITLLLNPKLRSVLKEESGSSLFPPPPTAVATPVPATIPKPVAPPVPAPTRKPLAPLVPAPTRNPVALPPLQQSDSTFETTLDCPKSDSRGRYQVLQAEDAELYSALIKTKARNYCGVGYVDFDDLDAGFVVPPSSGTDGGYSASSGKSPVFSKKDGIFPSGNREPVVASRQGNVVGISFEVEITFPGDYEVTVRYANGGPLSSRRSGMFMVDGNFPNNNYEYRFGNTYGWNIWFRESKTVVFETEGTHTLDFFWTEKRDRPNIDWVSVKLLAEY